MSEETRYPDAVLAPTDWKAGDNALVRGDKLARRVEATLGFEPSKRAYIRLADGNHHFCSGDPHDTLYFPKTHPREGQPRYRWEHQEDGSVHGFLVDDEAKGSVEWAHKNRGWMPAKATGVALGNA